MDEFENLKMEREFENGFISTQSHSHEDSEYSDFEVMGDKIISYSQLPYSSTIFTNYYVQQPYSTPSAGRTSQNTGGLF